MPERLAGTARHYEWGDPAFIPGLLGLDATGEPWAELWFGAHPSAPSPLGDTTLDRLIAADPITALGDVIASDFEDRLPFLVKILAAGEPLSLQAHPSREQAVAGYEREELQGMPRSSPRRSFRDRSHKPELVCALTQFEALCGIRDPAVTVGVLRMLDTAALDPVRERLAADSSPGGLRDLIGWLLRMDRRESTSLVDATVKACAHLGDGAGRRRAGRHSRGDHGALRAVAKLGARYASDPGVIIALLMNHVVLEPGEALFLGAGNLHCYLRGAAVEVMANSDNVLRGGLTSKHVDVDTLVEVLDTTATPAAVQRPATRHGVATYEAPVPEFCLRRVQVTRARPVAVGGGPAVLFCTHGRATINGVRIRSGQAVWAPATERHLTVSGDATVFAVHTGL